MKQHLLDQIAKREQVFKNQITTLEITITNLQSQISLQTNNSNNLQAQLNAKTQELANLAILNNQYSQQISNLQSNLSIANNKVALLDQTINNQQQQINNLEKLNQQYMEQDTITKTIVTQKDNELTKLAHDYQKVEHKLNEYKVISPKKDAQIKEFSFIIKDKDIQIIELQKTNSSVVEKYEELLAESPKKEQEITTLKIELEKKLYIIEEKDIEIKSLTELKSTYNLEHMKSTYSLDENQDYIALKDELKNLKTALTNKNDSIKNFDLVTQNYRYQLEQNSVLISELQKDKNYLRDDKEKLNNQICKLKNIFKSKLQTLTPQKVSNHEITEDLEENKQKIKMVTSEIVKPEDIDNKFSPILKNIDQTNNDYTLIGDITDDFELL